MNIYTMIYDYSKDAEMDINTRLQKAVTETITPSQVQHVQCLVLM